MYFQKSYSLLSYITTMLSAGALVDASIADVLDFLAPKQQHARKLTDLVAGEGSIMQVGASFLLENYIEPASDAELEAMVSDLEDEIAEAIQSTEYEVLQVNIIEVGQGTRRNLRSRSRELVTLTSPISYEVIIQRVCATGACDTVAHLEQTLYWALTHNLGTCSKLLHRLEAGSQNPNLAQAIVDYCSIAPEQDVVFHVLVYEHQYVGGGDCAQTATAAATDVTASSGTALALYDRIEMNSNVQHIADSEWDCSRSCAAIAETKYNIGYRGFHFQSQITCACLWDDGLAPTSDVLGAGFDACGATATTPWCSTTGYHANGDVNAPDSVINAATSTTAGVCYERDTAVKYFTKRPTPGRCQDSRNQKYDYVMFQTIGFVDDCAKKCIETAVTKSKELHLTSFTFSHSRGKTLCYCEFNDRNAPSFPRGSEGTTNANFLGVGVVGSTDVNMVDASFHHCYSYDYYGQAAPQI